MSVRMHIPGVSDLTAENKSPFVFNHWYVAALSKELNDQPLARTLLNEPVVMFRDGDGKVSALADRCCHKALPLSAGLVEAGGIRCGYHGLLFNGAGQCIEIPGQAIIPKRAMVKSYTLQERDGLIWIWFGDEQTPKPSCDAPNYPVHNDPNYVWDGDVYHYQAPYQLIHDNLLDLSHLGYVHLKTIGGDAKTHMNADMKTTTEGDSVSVVRHMPNVTPPPTYSAAFPFQGPIDRWQEIDFQVTHLKIWTGGADVGSCDLNDPNRGGFHLKGFHGITPETETTSHYLWTMATNPAMERETVLEKVIDQTAFTFDEDKVVIENQYRNMKQFGNQPMISIHVDSGANRARIIMERLRTQPA